MSVTLQCLHARFRLIIPNLRQLIVRTGDEIRTVPAGEVVDAVYPLLVPFQRKVAHGRRHVPHLYGAIERRARKCIRVLGVENHVHDVVRVSLEHHRAIPLSLPIPKLDEHVVRTRHHVRLRRVHRDRSNVILMRFKPNHQFGRVIVVHSHEHVVGSGRDPLFARDPFRRSHRQLRHLERLHQRVRLVIPYRHVPTVQIRQYPRFRRVDLHPFHPVAPLHEFPLDVKSHRHLVLLVLLVLVLTARASSSSRTHARGRPCARVVDSRTTPSAHPSRPIHPFVRASAGPA